MSRRTFEELKNCTIYLFRCCQASRCLRVRKWGQWMCGGKTQEYLFDSIVSFQSYNTLAKIVVFWVIKGKGIEMMCKVLNLTYRLCQLIPYNIGKEGSILTWRNWENEKLRNSPRSLGNFCCCCFEEPHVVVFWAYKWLCSQITLFEGLENHMGCLWSNPSQLCVRQVPCPL